MKVFSNLLNFIFQANEINVQALATELLVYVKKFWTRKLPKVFGTLYTTMKDHDHGNVESPQNTSKGRPLEIQKSFMCEHGLSSVK